jgi:hypothetical protein
MFYSLPHVKIKKKVFYHSVSVFESSMVYRGGKSHTANFYI